MRSGREVGTLFRIDRRITSSSNPSPSGRVKGEGQIYREVVLRSILSIATVLALVAVADMHATDAFAGDGGRPRANGFNPLGGNAGGPTNFGPQAGPNAGLVLPGGPNAQQVANEALLRQFDANGDGRLDAAERQAMQTAAAQLRVGGPDLAKAKWLQQFDVNGNGKLDADELKAAKAALSKGVPLGFRGLPSGGVKTGSLGAGQQGVGQQGAGGAADPAGAKVGGNQPKGHSAKDKLLQEFDTNHDGKLDAKERAEMQKTLAERRKAEAESKKANKKK